MKIGPQVGPPKPLVCSTMHEIAIWGSLAGAKPMNQASLTPVEISAVPVLPATSMPETAPAVPVPSLTTLCIIVLSV